MRPLDTERDEDEELSIVLGPPDDWAAERPLVPRRALRNAARDALRSIYDDLEGEVLSLDDD